LEKEKGTLHNLNFVLFSSVRQ